jgi:hypothetical protein
MVGSALVEASGVADGEAFVGIGLERFAFEDDLRTLWNGSGILIPFRLSWWRSSEISSLPYKRGASRIPIVSRFNSS